MNELIDQDPKPAIFPDEKEKPLSLRVVEEYLTRCDSALVKLQENLTKINANKKQHEDELLVVNGQKILLLSLQKEFVKE